jgi:hypothetical protein
MPSYIHPLNPIYKSFGKGPVKIVFSVKNKWKFKSARVHQLSGRGDEKGRKWVEKLLEVKDDKVRSQCSMSRLQV